MVTGASVTQQTSGNAKPGGCLVYVTDVKSGMFAAYTMPWNRSMESTGDMQKGPMVCVGGDAFRTPMGGSSSSKKAIPTPTPTKETSKEKAVPK